MGKHTPGPWHRNIKAAGKYPTIFAGRNTHVAVAAQMESGDETEANIDLIAAAPDLLAALEHMLGACDPTVDREDDEHFDYADAYIACDAARAAIAKARGEA